MDSLTHIALGVCIGEAFFGRLIGKKAMVWGAFAQSVPDIDFVAAFWMSPAENLLAHRGFTHSIIFILIVTPFLSLLAERWHRLHNISIRKWMIFFFLQMFIHIFIDAFNNYGVGWFEPFSHYRISFNTIFVADPFFSIWPAITFVALLLLKTRHRKRIFWWRFAIIMSSIYLCYCTINKINIDSDVKEIAVHQNINYTKYFTTPAPLNNWLWYVVLGDDSGFYVGYRSLFDTKKEIDFKFLPRNDSFLDSAHNHEELQKLIRFSQGFYTVEKWNDTLVFNDLRFGQITGWQDPKEKFVFHYFLKHSADNSLVVQRGRFAKWNWEIMKSLLKRIKGN
jgi:inner membrane protein